MWIWMVTLYFPTRFPVSVMQPHYTLLKTWFSAQNPPPLCIPIPIPYVPIQVETCAKLFDIHTAGQSLHMCFDFETRIERAPVLVLHFECMQIGSNGVNFVKPGHVDTPSSTALPGQDIYDVVTEVKVRKFKP